MFASQLNICINKRGIQERDALLKIFALVGTLMDEEAFHALVGKLKSQTEEASVDGKHVRKRITLGEQAAADAERFAEMERKGIKQTREGFADTGDRPYGKEGLSNVVIDGLLEQLERHYVLFGVRLEQKADRYTARDVEWEARRGRTVKAGEPKKTPKGGEVFLYKLRFFFFKKEHAKIHQAELFARLKEYARTTIHRRGDAFYNDHDIDVLELSGEPQGSVESVNRALYDDDGFYKKTIENSDRGMQEPIERRPSLTASLSERIGSPVSSLTASVPKRRQNGDAPPNNS